MNKIAIIITTTLFAVGCATAPATYTFDNSRTYDREFDDVWESIVQYFATNNIEIKNIAKDSGVIYAERARFDDSVADCGSAGLASVVGRTANFNVFVTDRNGQTNVSVNTRFNEVRRFDYNNWEQECSSRGVLETTILDAIER